MGQESCDMVRFDLGPLVQDQMRSAKLTSAYALLIIAPRGLEYETHGLGILWCG